MSIQPTPTPSGLLIVDKPLRVTSAGVVAGVKRRLIAGGAPKSTKVGHGGTLDPMATGIVVVLVGKATRMCDEIMAGEKRYVADVDLAHTSPTDDREAVPVPVAVARPPTRGEVEGACARFVGEIDQVPPIHSAVWVDGQRAYRLARRGEAPELRARRVVVHAIELLAYDWPIVRLDIRCGKGTYIRSLARDLGRALGAGGMLVGLRRTGVGPHTIDRAVELDRLPERLTPTDLLPLE